MKPLLDKYVESRIEGRRQFELRDTGVFASGNLILAYSFETLVLYSQLLPNVTVIRRRHPIFWYGVLGLPVFCFIYYVLVFQANLPLDSFFPGMCAGMALLSIILTIATHKNIEYVRFCSESGVALLEIAKSGPDVAIFDTFVDQIQSAIRHSRNDAG